MAGAPACGMTELFEGYQTRWEPWACDRCQEVSSEVPPMGLVELKAGGLHIMCMDKKQDFTSGIHFP